jgi:predicted nucleic acid-binding protein
MYFVDRNVMQNLGGNGDANVRKWRNSVNDTDIFIPVIAIREAWYGCEKVRNSQPRSADLGIAATRAILAAFDGQVLPLNELAAIEWAKLLVELGRKNEADWFYIAVAKATGWTLVTRNIKDMVDRGARLLNPFTDPPTIIEVDDRID